MKFQPHKDLKYYVEIEGVWEQNKLLRKKGSLESVTEILQKDGYKNLT
jgi:hypothetical protein